MPRGPRRLVRAGFGALSSIVGRNIPARWAPWRSNFSSLIWGWERMFSPARKSRRSTRLFFFIIACYGSRSVNSATSRGSNGPSAGRLVLSKGEVARILELMSGTHQLIRRLLFSARDSVARMSTAGAGCAMSGLSEGGFGAGLGDGRVGLPGTGVGGPLPEADAGPQVA